MLHLSNALLHSAPHAASSAAKPREEASSILISNQDLTGVALQVDRGERGVCIATALLEIQDLSSVPLADISWDACTAKG